MTPAANCPQCAAPLPPGAAKCQFCGFLTPWGARLQHHQSEQQAFNASREQSDRASKAHAKAKTGMILALVGLPICCGPLSLVGGILGYQGARAAKQAGIPRPTTSIVAMVAAVLSMCAFVTGTVVFIRDQQKHDDRLTEVRARLAGKREAATIDQKVACDVAEEFLLHKGWKDHTLNLETVHCDGALSVTDRRASLPDVRFNYSTAHFAATMCLEKRSRWFVIRVLESGTCADLPPPAPFTAPARTFTDEEAWADESKARDELVGSMSSSAVKLFAEKLSKVRADAASAPAAEKLCSKADLSKYVSGDSRRKVPSVDYDLLNATKTSKGVAIDWSFLSDDDLEKFLDAKRSDADRFKDMEAARSDGGPLLVVYRASKKLWPQVADGKNFDGGEFEGWLFVYDVDTAARLCATPLIFASSGEVEFRKGRFSSAKDKLADAVQADFKDNFETAATDAIKRAAPDLRLGYKTLE